MKKKNRLKRVTSAFLAVLLCVTLNIEPVSVIAGALCETEFIKDCEVLYNNLKYLASNGFDSVKAAETAEESGGCDCDFSCNYNQTALLLAIAGGNNGVPSGVTLSQINANVDTVESVLGNHTSALSGISSSISGVSGSITDLDSDVASLQGTADSIYDIVDGLGSEIVLGVTGGTENCAGKTLSDIYTLIEDTSEEQQKFIQDNVIGNSDDNKSMYAINQELDSIDDRLGDVNNTLQDILDEQRQTNIWLEKIEGTLGLIQGELDGMTHDYRVAHLYSINNSEATALWRPTTNELPYVKDFAHVTGGFANVYTGYWDSFITPVDKGNPILNLKDKDYTAGSTRAYEVLGYDSVLRREGMIILGEAAYCDRHGDRVYFEFRNLAGYYHISCGDRYYNGQLVCPECLKSIPNGTAGAVGITTAQNWETLITYEQEAIPYEDITWFDAVTVLYKALGEEEITYRAFMYHNENITPENSPAYQNLSNIDGFDGFDFQYVDMYDFMYEYKLDKNGVKQDTDKNGVIDELDMVAVDFNKDGKVDDSDKFLRTVAVDQNGDGKITIADKTVIGKKKFQGYDYKIFTSRTNMFTGTVKMVEGQGTKDKSDDVYDTKENAMAQKETYDIYWIKALNDGFVLDENKDKPIAGQDFFKLCKRMMEAYGEPVLNQDEVDALLQVYGAEYPIQLGVEIADAWAYLKVRGCLNVDISYTGTITRDQLLDVAMCIKDEGSRTDYKNIDIVLDLSDVMISDGYYPVADLNIAQGDFSATTTYNWGVSNYYDILIPVFDMKVTYKNNEESATSDITNFAVLTSSNAKDFKYETYLEMEAIERQAYLNSFGVIQNSYQGTIETEGHTYHHFRITRPKDVTGQGKLKPPTVVIVPTNIYNDMVLTNADNEVSLNYKFLEVPNKFNVGGIWTSIRGSNDGYYFIDSNPRFFSTLAETNKFLKFTDAERAGDLEFVKAGIAEIAYLPNDPTLLESLVYHWDLLTTPIVAYADEPNQPADDTVQTVRIGFANMDNTQSDFDIVVNEDSMGVETFNETIGMNYLSRANRPDSATALLNRLVTVYEAPLMASVMQNANKPNSSGFAKYWTYMGTSLDGTDIVNNVTTSITYNNPNKFDPITTGVARISRNMELYGECEDWNKYKQTNSGISIYGVPAPDLDLEFSYWISQWPAKFVLAMEGMNGLDWDGIIQNKYSTYVTNYINAAQANQNYNPTVVTNTAYNIFMGMFYADLHLVSNIELAPQITANEDDRINMVNYGSYPYSKIFWTKALGEVPNVNDYDNYDFYNQQIGKLTTDLDEYWISTKDDWNAIWDLSVEYQIVDAVLEEDGSISISIKGDPEAFIAAIGEILSKRNSYMSDEFMGEDISTLLSTSVKTSAIMSRKENVLISWEDLKTCGFVIDTFDGRNPEKDAAGVYNIQTVYGLVKVNPGAHTILIGNTYYNLDDNGTGPALVYIQPGDNTGDKDIFYLDYRCIMGLCSENIRYDEKMTTAIKAEDSLGVGNSVVYSITAGEVSSKLFTSKEYNTFIYPDISKFAAKSSIGQQSYYKTNLLSKTMYDGQTIVNNNVANGNAGHEFLYWDPEKIGDRKRMSMSTFNPISNWMVSVRQTDADTQAHLYVWYPRIAFQTYAGTNEPNFIDIDGKVGKRIPGDNTGRTKDDWKFLAEDAVSNCFTYDGRSFDGIWNSVYSGVSESDMEWYDWMTKYATACLFNETNGGYYISKDYVCRRFDLTDSTAVSPTNEFSSITNLTSNDIGAMYWLEGIGFVYNIPNLNEFNLLDYFEGTIPLPVALDHYSTFGVQSLINFNVDYYGTINTANTNVTDGALSITNKSSYVSRYGEVISAVGVVDLAGNVLSRQVASGSTINLTNNNLLGYWSNEETRQLLQQSIEEEYPYDIGEASTYVPAPAGMYTVFGGMADESTTVRGLTGYVTSANHVYYGSKRLHFDRSDTGNYYFFLGMGNYPAVSIPDNIGFKRVYHNTYDVLVAFAGNIATDSGGRVAKVDISNEYTNPLRNFLDGWGALSLLESIDEGASYAILIGLKVMPMIGIILMTILIGLAFLGETKWFRDLCDKIFDPVKLLTFGNRSIHTWEYRRVMLPCVLLYIAFALFLNGNVIRVIVKLAEWYDVIVRWASTW